MDDIAHLVACSCCGELKKGSEIARTEKHDSTLFRVLAPDSPVVVARTTTAEGLLRVCSYCYNNGLKQGKRPRRAFHFPLKDCRLTAGRTHNSARQIIQRTFIPRVMSWMASCDVASSRFSPGPTSRS